MDWLVRYWIMIAGGANIFFVPIAASTLRVDHFVFCGMAPGKYHKHPRLPGHNYTHGSYFVTICTRDRRHWFGRVIGSGPGAIMEPNDLGRIVLTDWHALPDHFPNIRLGQVQLMPHHLHGIIIINGGGSTRRVDAAGAVPKISARPRGPRPGSLGAIIAA